MDLEFDVKITTGVLYDFKIQHTYKKPITILATALGFVSIYLFFAREDNTRLLFLVLGIIFIVYEPVMAIYHSYVQAKLTPAFQQPLHYRFCEEGIEISQNGETQMAKWEQCVKACNTRKSIFLYTSKVNAFIFPRVDLGNQAEDVIAYIAKHVSPEAMKIRF
ncbi:MAG: YcxB family protein [Lachnospiraceae bacterium]|nr:YcxB family protein [Lachnospiraceae bacterium]